MKRKPIVALLALLLLMGVLVARFALRRTAGGSAPVHTGLISPGASFETWADYVKADTENKNDRRKVVFVGVDGGCWNIIDPLIEEGLLPTFKKLKKEGSWGILQSVECYVSPPAWTTMMTGYLPERTGVFSFGSWDRKRRQFIHVKSGDIKTPSVWDAISFAGRRVAAANIPATYPVREINGIMISGLLTPATLDDQELKIVTCETDSTAGAPATKSFSPVTHGRFEHAGTPVEMFVFDTSDDGQTRYDVVRLQIGERTDDQANIAEFRLGHYSDWLQIDHVKDGERQKAWCKFLVSSTIRASKYAVAISAVFFDVGETEVQFAYPDSLKDELKRAFNHYFPSKFSEPGLVTSLTTDAVEYAKFFYDYEAWDAYFYVFTQPDNIQHIVGVSDLTKSVYQIIDGFLADLLKKLPDDTTLIIASDHGFNHYTYTIDLNRLLARMELLAYDEEENIDLDQTVVFHNLWNLYFNDALLNGDELKKRRIEVLPHQAPREALLRFLERAKPSLMNPVTNQNMSVEFTRFPENEFEHAPDMVVKGTYSDYMVDFWNVRRPRKTIMVPLRADEQWNHTREGMYLFHGKTIKRGFAAPVENIQDITPTILYLLGLPLAEDMDGRIMRSVIETRRMEETSYAVLKGYNQLYSQAPTDDTPENLEKQLRSLGYIR
jgi:predicted AlkP superfamily phosphohydrolase/phosphomutase